MVSINQDIMVPPPIGGQRCDVPRSMVPEGYAYDLLNFLPRGGIFAVRPGWVQVGNSLGEIPNGLISYDHHSGVKKMVCSTLYKCYAWNPSTLEWDAISGITWASWVEDVMCFRTFWKNSKTYLLMTNGIDYPMKWDGSTASQIGGTPPHSRTMAVLANRVILGGTASAPYQIDVSNYNDCDTGWGSVQVVNLMDTPGDIVAIKEMGNLQAVVYKSDSIYTMIAQAALAPFRFELKQAGVSGPITERAIVETPLGHYFINQRGDIAMFDGFRLTMLPLNIKAHLDKTIDRTQMMLRRAFGVYNSYYREVWFFYCSTASDAPDIGMVVRLDDSSVWPFELNSFKATGGCLSDVQYGEDLGDQGATSLGAAGGSLGDYGNIVPGMLVCTQGKKTFMQGGNTDDASPIRFVAETGLVNVAKRGFVTVNEADHFFGKPSSSQLVTAKVGKSKSGEDPTYSPARDFDIAEEGPHVTSFRESSRLVSLRYDGHADQPVEWRGSVITGRGRGKR